MDLVLDALINRTLSVQMMHQQFVALDVLKLARDQTKTLGWLINPQSLARV